MSTLVISHGRKTLLTFEAENMEAEKQSDALVLNATGETIKQEENVVELCQTEGECFVSLTHENETLLEGRFAVSFLLFEANQIVVRLAAV